MRGLERAYKYGYYAKDLEGKDQKDGFYSELRGRKFVDPLFDKLFSKLKGTNPTAFMSYLADSMGNSIFNQYCLQKHFSQLDSDGMAKVRNFYLKRFSNGVYSPFNWNEMDPIEQKKIITFLSQQKQKDDLAKLMLLDVGRYDIFTKEEVVDLIYNSSVIFAYS
ncbi:hypothetical protein FACS189428_5660 [Clostridia bacterium]|nr:hypothetical protein FACS189428_5660 [Clostridia bacterium]